MDARRTDRDVSRRCGPVAVAGTNEQRVELAPDVGKRARLAAAIDAALREVSGPMVWGEDDCGLWFANVIKAALGYDPVYEFRGRYKTAFGCKRLTAKYGGLRGILDHIAKARGWRQIKPSAALIGDVGLVAGPTCMLKHHTLWVGRTDGGFGAAPTENIIAAWRVK